MVRAIVGVMSTIVVLSHLPSTRTLRGVLRLRFFFCVALPGHLLGYDYDQGDGGCDEHNRVFSHILSTHALGGVSQGDFWGMMRIRAMKVGVMSTTVFFPICHLPGHLFGSDGSVRLARYLPGCFLGYDDDEGGCDEHNRVL